MPKPRRVVLAATTALIPALLTGCSDAGLRYATDYANHEPLHVVGYPSTGTLQATQEVVWRLADGSTDELAALATSDSTEGEAKTTAANWIKGFRKGAAGKVTADFYDEGSERQVVALYFHDTGQVKDIMVRLDGLAGEAGWRVMMRETDPREATTPPDWAPKKPGGTGSVSVD